MHDLLTETRNFEALTEYLFFFTYIVFVTYLPAWSGDDPVVAKPGPTGQSPLLSAVHQSSTS